MASPPLLLPLLPLLLLFLIPHAHAQSAPTGGDVCGDTICGPTENLYWCSQDCGGTCGDSLCSRDESYLTCTDCACPVGTETAEEKLGSLINTYRVSNGLPAIPLGQHITIVARAHARDTAVSSQTIPSFGDRCNLHSWSTRTFDGLSFSSCCYTSDHAQASCMWNKPRELTPLTGTGFEISALGYGSVETALEGWKGSPGHNSVILNLGGWADVSFTSMGVGVDLTAAREVYHVWFYNGGDDIPKAPECKGLIGGSGGRGGGGGGGVGQETALPTPSQSMPPPPPPPPAPSCSESTLGLSVVERTSTTVGNAQSTVYTQRLSLWQGDIANVAAAPPSLITLPGIPTALLKNKKSKVMLRIALCGTNRKVVLRYYRADATASSRRAKKTIREDKGGMAFDDLEKTVKKVFGKKKSKKKWAAEYIRMNVWIDKKDSETPTLSFRLDGTS